MCRGNLVGEITIGLRLELVHYDSEYSTALFTGPARGSFHDAEVAACANGETGLGKPRTDLHRLLVFVALRVKFRPAKYGYYSVTRWIHQSIKSPLHYMRHCTERKS